MNSTYNLLKSRTFWTIVILSILPIANAIVPTLPMGMQAFAEAALGALASLFHKNTADRVGATN